MRMDVQGQGRCLAVEGIDGSGKSSLVRALATELRDRGITVATVAEPTSGRLGKLARSLVTEDPLGAALIFTLDRMGSRGKLERLLATNSCVICDRSFYSTLAYQGSLLPPAIRSQLRRLEEQVALSPDLILLLEGPLDLALARLDRRGGRDSIEQRKLLRRVSAEYARLARKEPLLFVHLDFTRSRSELVERALQAVSSKWPLTFADPGRARV
jgi:dTMP kinase